MARTSTKLSTSDRNEELSELKRNVSILHLCANYGIELTRHGMHDYKGVCPFHDDEEPSFIVTPSKNLFHCMGCDAGGSVIDLVMKKEGLTINQAIDKLIACNGLVKRGTSAKPEQERKPVAEERTQQLLDRCITIYEKTFTENEQARQYLESRGITDAGLYTKHRIGYSNGQLNKILPENGGVREDLDHIYIWKVINIH